MWLPDFSSLDELFTFILGLQRLATGSHHSLVIIIKNISFSPVSSYRVLADIGNKSSV
jgi:hypothetical protein